MVSVTVVKLVALADMVVDPAATPLSVGVDEGVVEPALNIRVVADNVAAAVLLLVSETNTVDVGAGVMVTGN
jgi:hypothetical protein